VTSRAPQYSLEFFPPRTGDGVTKLRAARAEFARLKPAFCSVTFGAGGSTREGTLATVLEIRADGMEGAPHVSCIGSTRDGIRDVLHEYRGHGIRHLVALRGDLPSGMGRMGDLHYAADLVAFIREEHGDHFRIEVGCYPDMHPQSEDALADLKHFKAKMDAGAHSAITQYFFNADAYFRFVDDARRMGVTAPIIPGIMPISNFTQLKRFSEACGAEIPRWIGKRMAAYGDDAESVRELAADVVAGMCQRLIDNGVAELHFYTLNLAKPTQAVLSRLR
jgi:methylenetetrahydrofolate reductase (NADPH)